jgi:hypothetical protein
VRRRVRQSEDGVPIMLVEKFFLILETLISHITDTARYPDGGPKVLSRARRVPIKLPETDRPEAA